MQVLVCASVFSVFKYSKDFDDVVFVVVWIIYCQSVGIMEHGQNPLTETHHMRIQYDEHQTKITSSLDATKKEAILNLEYIISCGCCLYVRRLCFCEYPGVHTFKNIFTTLLPAALPCPACPPLLSVVLFENRFFQS